jgi:tetratricopeptide (TPR) repeat protein
MPLNTYRVLEKGSRRALAASFFALTLAFAPAAISPAVAQDAGTLQVSPPQARALARQAAMKGDIRTADAVSSALLLRDPDDAEALLVRAIVLRAAGRFPEAAAASARAFRNTDNPALRFDAAMMTADIQARQERFTRAQIWLRRADQVAPDEARQNMAEQGYQQVAKRNPLSVQLRFSLRPSNNVNNGAETTEIEIGGLPFRLDDSGQQLGGYEASGGVSLSYRLSESETQRTTALGELYYKRVWLDSEARILAPGAEGSDYNYGVVIAGVRHQRMIWPEIGPSQITGLIGQSWYGDSPLARWAEVQLGQTVQRSDKSALRFGLTGRTESRLDASINDATSLGLSAEYIRITDDGGRYSFGASVRDVQSDSATVDQLSFGLSASRSFAQIGAFQPRISLEAETRDYRKWSSTPGGREDNSLALRLDVTWPDISYYGFVPQMSLNASRTWSDVDIYDRNAISLGLTAVSRF